MAPSFSLAGLFLGMTVSKKWLLLPLAVRRPYEVLVLVCVGTPVVLETAQLLGSLAAGWAWRAFDVDDLLLNTVGGLLELCLTGLLLQLLLIEHLLLPELVDS